MNPAANEGFEWDDGNESHLARKRISFWEAEEVFWNNPTWAKDKRGRSGDYFMYGSTKAGRKLTLVVKVNASRRTLRVITGWDCTKGERTRYLDE